MIMDEYEDEMTMQAKRGGREGGREGAHGRACLPIS